MAVYLVTGGCGFIGSHLCDALVAQGHAVRILDDLSTGKLANKPAAAELLRGDVADPELAARAMADVDGCFHLAAVASVERGHQDWLGTHRTNLTGAITIFDAARRPRAEGTSTPVVYASSAAVYGDNPQLPLGETAATRPLSAYGADKLGCELHGHVATHVHGVPTAGLRFFNVFGPRQDPKSPYSGVISTFCDRLRAGTGIRIDGDGQQTRDFIYVGDVVAALLSAMAGMTDDSPVFNVCTGLATSILALAQLIAELCGRAPDIAFAARRAGDIRASVGDPRRATEDLGFTAKVPLRDGLALTLASGAPGEGVG
ncbi:MAG: epimerase [Rhodospirillales bacterium]|nr:epimerase [Rhodospirillales bacterium]